MTRFDSNANIMSEWNILVCRSVIVPTLRLDRIELQNTEPRSAVILLTSAIAVPVGAACPPDDDSLCGDQGSRAWCDHDGGRGYDRSTANDNNTRRHDGRRNDGGHCGRPHRWC